MGQRESRWLLWDSASAAFREQTLTIQVLQSRSTLGNGAAQFAVEQFVANEEASFCPRCARSFGVKRRRHHCRCCGICACDECSLERHQLVLDQPPVRVCDGCPRLAGQQFWLAGQERLKRGREEQAERDWLQQAADDSAEKQRQREADLDEQIRRALTPRACEYAVAQLVPEAQHCPKCQKDFGLGLLRRRHHCASCGDCVCDDCFKPNGAVELVTGEGPVRICLNCPNDAVLNAPGAGHVAISGAVGESASSVNGRFDLVEPEVYRKTDGGAAASEWLFADSDGRWVVSDTEAKDARRSPGRGRIDGAAWAHSVARSAAGALPPSGANRWQLRERGRDLGPDVAQGRGLGADEGHLPAQRPRGRPGRARAVRVRRRRAPDRGERRDPADGRLLARSVRR